MDVYIYIFFFQVLSPFNKPDGSAHPNQMLYMPA
jgi:hypothetical protein